MEYFNSTAVRTALHVNEKLPDFQFFSAALDYISPVEATQLIHHILKVQGYRMIMLFGNTDGSCSLMGTRRWIKRNGWVATKAWTPWTRQGQLSGFTVSYDNYTLVTMHGLGHGAIYNLPQVSTEIMLDFAHSMPFKYE